MLQCESAGLHSRDSGELRDGSVPWLARRDRCGAVYGGRAGGLRPEQERPAAVVRRGRAALLRTVSDVSCGDVRVCCWGLVVSSVRGWHVLDDDRSCGLPLQKFLSVLDALGGSTWQVQPAPPRANIVEREPTPAALVF
jgi:hypothetical protein